MNAIIEKKYFAEQFTPVVNAPAAYCLSGVNSRPNACMRVFAFPFAGGDISAFYSWLDWLPGEIELVRIQMPARGIRHSDAMPSSMRELARTISNAVSVLSDKPAVFFGYSMGALLAHAVMLHMRSNGFIGPRQLCVAACNPPHLHQQDWKRMSDETLSNVLIKSDPLWMQNIQLEPLQKKLDLIRRDLYLCQEYVKALPLLPQRLDCPITTFGGDLDTIAILNTLPHWRQYTLASCVSHRVDGGHFFLLNTISSQLPMLLMRELKQLLKKINSS